MKLLLFISLLSLAACAKAPTNDADALSCQSYLSPYMALHPDQTFKKSDIAACSDGTYKVTSLEVGDESTYYASGVVIELKSAQTGTPYQTTFAGQ